MDPITLLLGLGNKVIERLWPDPAQAASAKLELLKLQQSGELAQLTADTNLMLEQIKVNAIEAQSPSLLVSGWRPMIGWVCGAACAWNWLGLPIAKLLLALLGQPLELSGANLSEMLPVLLGMLGLGALRTTEKIKGVA